MEIISCEVCPIRKLHIARKYMFYVLYYTESIYLKNVIVLIHQQMIVITNK